MSVIVSEKVTLFFKGDFGEFTGTFLLNNKKSVITIGGIYLFSVNDFGLKAINPSILPKYNLPLLSLKLER